MKLTLFTLLFAVSTTALANHHVSLARASSIAQAVRACGAKNKWSLSIAIVNSEGNLVYFERADDAYSGSIDAAIGKARSANGFRRPTSAFTQGLKDGRIGLLTVPGIVAIEGGVPVTEKGAHVGGLGVSGAKASEDEQCALEGLK